jgi:hypothetical protein
MGHGLFLFWCDRGDDKGASIERRGGDTRR